VEAPIVLDRCRLIVNAALGDPSQNGGKDDGKTQASRGEHQVRQRLTEAVDDRVGVGAFTVGKARTVGPTASDEERWEIIRPPPVRT
jgi:hypothetical protein